MVKNSEILISRLLQVNELKELNNRFPVHEFLQKILTKHLFDMVLFAKFQNNTLSIGVHHPTAQFELTNFKPILTQYAKQSPFLSTIQDIKIFRYDKLKPKPLTSVEYTKIDYYPEKSYGIFENCLKDKELYDKMEKIRNSIKKGQKWK